MGKNNCCVPKCKSGYLSDKEKISIFKIPAKKLAAWSKNIRRKDRKLTTRDFICEKHFEPQFIIHELKTDVFPIPLDIRKLHKEAVPTIFPNHRIYLRKRTEKKQTIQKQVVPVIKKEELMEPAKNQEKLVETTSHAKSLPSDPILTTSQLFYQNLLNNVEMLSLPSSSWTIHLFAEAIVIFDMTSIDYNIVIKKKVIIRRNTILCYIFENLYEDKGLANILTTDDLQTFLNSFDTLPVCYGGISLLDRRVETFKSPSYDTDKICNCLRHVNCTYVITIDEEHTNRWICQHCKNVPRLMLHYRRRQNHMNCSKMRVQMNFHNLRLRENRLRKENERILNELRRVKEKIKETDQYNIEATIAERDIKIEEHDIKIEEHDIKIEEYDIKIEKHDIQIEEHDTKIEEHDIKIEKHHIKIEEHHIKIEEPDIKIEELDIHSHQKGEGENVHMEVAIDNDN